MTDAMIHARFLMKQVMGMSDTDINEACCPTARKRLICAGVAEAEHMRRPDWAATALRQLRTGNYGGAAGPVDEKYHGR